jgi:hypothetical protein
VPEAANVFFEATGIDDGEATLNTFNYEFTSQVSTQTDANGNAAYAIPLPPGEYFVTVRPVDDLAEVTVFPSVSVPRASEGSPVNQSFDLDTQQPVTGVATLADGRSLVGASVDVVPTQCSVTAPDTTYCLPRASLPATTDANGHFALNLDVGSYFLRVRPADGTALPWVVQSLVVTPDGTQTNIMVPAPFYEPVSLQLESAPVVNALVRVYDTSYGTPQSPAAAEVYSAVTDTAGHFDLYLAPPTE